MGSKRSITALVSAAAAGIGLWLLAPAFACSPGAILTLEGPAIPGQSVMVSGEKFSHESGEASIWLNDDNTVDQLLLAHVMPDVNGEFRTSITIPADIDTSVRHYLVATQGRTTNSNGQTDSNTSDAQEVHLEAAPPPPTPPPLTSTATPVDNPSTPVPVRAPRSSGSSEPAATPLADEVAAVEPVATTPLVLVPTPAGVNESSPLAQVLPGTSQASGAGLVLGQPVAGQFPGVILPADDSGAGGAAVVGAPAAVGTLGESGVVLGTPPPTEMGTSRSATPVLVLATLVGMALLGLGAELARRRATAAT